jgi:S-adenosylmethionine synthetase
VSIRIEALAARGGDALPFEVVERKGAGHPDTIADAVAEGVSLALCRQYRKSFGRVMHHNVDKSLLWGGAAESAFGGGRVLKPMELFIAGRATTAVRGEVVPVDAIATETARNWFQANLPMVDVRAGLKVHSLIRPGSADLVELFERQQRLAAPLSNDTSIGVGFAPLSRLETAVAGIARRLNGSEVRRHSPEIGPDIKVLGIRNGEAATFTVAIAFIDRHIRDAKHYLERKAAAEALVRDIATASGFRDPEIAVNAADDAAAGSFYLTVTGTSAEAGDDGQAGRGNRVNGLITPFRPMSIESFAGKNPVTHVGNLYNIAAGLIAQAIADGVPDIAEAHCHLVSQIGRPVTSPHFASVFVAPRQGHDIGRFEAEIVRIVNAELSRIPGIASELLEGSLKTDRWPLRRAGNAHTKPIGSAQS